MTRIERKEKRISSHLPILEFLYSLKKFDNVLEFGCGGHSTNFFVNNSKKVTSIEMASIDWYNRVKKNITANNFQIFFMPDETGIDWLKNQEQKYDLIFVDNLKRVECINASFGKSPVIVAHDLGVRGVIGGYLKKIDKNPYEFMILGAFRPRTSAWISDIELFNKIKLDQLYVRMNYKNYL